MGLNIRTFKDFRDYLRDELRDIYPLREIDAIARILIDYLEPGDARTPGISRNEQTIGSGTAARLMEMAVDLKKGMPVQYITGETLFLDCKLEVTGATLIPRQETEELAAMIIRENHGFNGNIIDIGTGSGCIAIALAKKLPAARVTATDISDDALLVAAGNADRNGVSVTFCRSDILDGTGTCLPPADIIVSNPPYVRESEKKLMHRNVIDFEPHNALFVPDNDPLVFYRAILSFASTGLDNGGKLYLEINEASGSDMVMLFRGSGYSDVSLVKDLNGRDRFIKVVKDD